MISLVRGEREGEAMNPHQGHRERRKRQFRDFGLDAFADHEALELLLFFAIPRQDTNPLAHELLSRFGSLEAVLEASVEELTAVPGIGENAALLLRLVPALSRRAAGPAGGRTVILNSLERVGSYLLRRYQGETREVVYELCLDQKGKLLTCCRVAEGSGASADFNVRTVLMNAIRCGASLVVLSHNHPSGLALPSAADQAATERVQRALDTVGIQLLDHIVVADGDFVSMAQNGTLRPAPL